MRTTQKSLFDYFDHGDVKKRYARLAHGGVPSKGHRKLERPLHTRRTHHLVMKSQHAKGKLSFLRPDHKIWIRRLIYQKARKFGVRIADYGNAGNHLHLQIRIQSRAQFQKYLKSVTCLIARKVTGARRGKKFGKFWDNLAYTRVLKSYTEQMNLRGYIQANIIEVENSPAARERFLKFFNNWVYNEWRKKPSRPRMRCGEESSRK